MSVSTLSLYTTYYKTASGDEDRIQGSALTAVDAKAEHDAILKVTVAATVLATKKSDVVTPTATAGGTGAYEQATLLLKRTSDGRKTTKTIKRMATSYKAAANDGTVDITNADIIAIATAYRDSAGVGGYVVYDGVFKK